MLKFLLNRLFYGILVLFGVILIVFFSFHVLPGDPAMMIAGKHTDERTMNAIRKDLGLGFAIIQAIGILSE